MLQGSNKKYFRRADLVAKEQEEYFKKYGHLQKEETKSTEKEHEGIYDFNLIFNCDVYIKFLKSGSADDGSEHMVLPRNEVITRLRDRCEAILLFGETELDAFKRLRKCEILEPEINRVCWEKDNLFNIYIFHFYRA